MLAHSSADDVADEVGFVTSGGETDAVHPLGRDEGRPMDRSSNPVRSRTGRRASLCQFLSASHRLRLRSKAAELNRQICVYRRTDERSRIGLSEGEVAVVAEK